MANLSPTTYVAGNPLLSSNKPITVISTPYGNDALDPRNSLSLNKLSPGSSGISRPRPSLRPPLVPPVTPFTSSSGNSLSKSNLPGISSTDRIASVALAPLPVIPTVPSMGSPNLSQTVLSAVPIPNVQFSNTVASSIPVSGLSSSVDQTIVSSIPLSSSASALPVLPAPPTPRLSASALPAPPTPRLSAPSPTLKTVSFSPSLNNDIKQERLSPVDNFIPVGSPEKPSISPKIGPLEVKSGGMTSIAGEDDIVTKLIEKGYIVQGHIIVDTENGNGQRVKYIKALDPNSQVVYIIPDNDGYVGVDQENLTVSKVNSASSISNSVKISTLNCLKSGVCGVAFTCNDEICFTNKNEKGEKQDEAFTITETHSIKIGNFAKEPLAYPIVKMSSILANPKSVLASTLDLSKRIRQAAYNKSLIQLNLMVNEVDVLKSKLLKFKGLLEQNYIGLENSTATLLSANERYYNSSKQVNGAKEVKMASVEEVKKHELVQLNLTMRNNAGLGGALVKISNDITNRAEQLVSFDKALDSSFITFHNFFVTVNKVLGKTEEDKIKLYMAH